MTMLDSPLEGDLSSLSCVKLSVSESKWSRSSLVLTYGFAELRLAARFAARDLPVFLKSLS